MPVRREGRVVTRTGRWGIYKRETQHCFAGGINSKTRNTPAFGTKQRDVAKKEPVLRQRGEVAGMAVIFLGFFGSLGDRGKFWPGHASFGRPVHAQPKQGRALLFLAERILPGGATAAGANKGRCQARGSEDDTEWATKEANWAFGRKEWSPCPRRNRGGLREPQSKSVLVDSLDRRRSGSHAHHVAVFPGYVGREKVWRADVIYRFALGFRCGSACKL